jgi:hypothetical protein
VAVVDASSPFFVFNCLSHFTVIAFASWCSIIAFFCFTASGTDKSETFGFSYTGYRYFKTELSTILCSLFNVTFPFSVVWKSYMVFLRAALSYILDLLSIFTGDEKGWGPKHKSLSYMI